MLANLKNIIHQYHYVYQDLSHNQHIVSSVIQLISNLIFDLKRTITLEYQNSKNLKTQLGKELRQKSMHIVEEFMKSGQQWQRMLAKSLGQIQESMRQIYEKLPFMQYEKVRIDEEESMINKKKKLIEKQLIRLQNIKNDEIKQKFYQDLSRKYKFEYSKMHEDKKIKDFSNKNYLKYFQKQYQQLHVQEQKLFSQNTQIIHELQSDYQSIFIKINKIWLQNQKQTINYHTVINDIIFEENDENLLGNDKSQQ